MKLIELNETNHDRLVTAAKNIRIELGTKYPSTKFAVKSKRFSMGDSISVDWTDGPTSKQVDDIIQKYNAGSFDGMVDLYTYDSNNVFTEKHGSGKYIHSNRHYTDPVIADVIEGLRKYYSASVAPTVKDYDNGETYNITPLANAQGEYAWTWQSLINRALHEKAA